MRSLNSNLVVVRADVLAGLASTSTVPRRTGVLRHSCRATVPFMSLHATRMAGCDKKLSFDDPEVWQHAIILRVNTVYHAAKLSMLVIPFAPIDPCERPFRAVFYTRTAMMRAFSNGVGKARMGTAADLTLGLVLAAGCAAVAHAGADTTFAPALTLFTNFLEGSGGKIITVMSLAGGVIGMASGRFSLGQIAVPVGVGVGVGTGIPIVTAAVTAVI